MRKIIRKYVEAVLWGSISYLLQLQMRFYLMFPQYQKRLDGFTATSNLEAKPHLRKSNRIRSIHSSLKIEANSLSLGQVRDVINGKMVLGEQKEIPGSQECPCCL